VTRTLDWWLLTFVYLGIVFDAGLVWVAVTTTGWP
jgi:hypothetical protein